MSARRDYRRMTPLEGVILVIGIVLVVIALAGNAWAATIRCPFDGSRWNGTCVGTVGADVMYGTAGSNRMYGRGGNDWMIGFAGFDYMIGGAGKDTIRSTDGESDYVHGDLPGQWFPGPDSCFADSDDYLHGCDRLRLSARR